jgi:hypothetical protein
MTQPTPSTVTTVASIIFATFVVSEAEAREKALGLVSLAEGWGGKNNLSIGWDHIVRTQLGNRHDWRSENARKEFMETKGQTVGAYENYIRARK